MSLAPIVLFVYNRPWHTLQVLEALSQNELANQSDLFIFCDGPKPNASPEVIKKNELVKKIVRGKSWCKTNTIIESQTNKGLANSIIDGVTNIVNEYGKIIVLEDDTMPAPSFLKFMNNALETYERSEEVISITGYVYPIEEKLPDTYFLKGADCWGWATWNRGWELFRKNGKELANEIAYKGLIHQFDFDGSYPYYKMLTDHINGKNDSWAIRWYASAFLANKLTLYPGETFILNIGLDGSGIHCGVTNEEQYFANKSGEISAIEIKENTTAKTAFKNYFKKDNKPTSTLLKRIAKKIYNTVRNLASPTQAVESKDFIGAHDSWQEAGKQCGNYESDKIFNKVTQAAIKIKNGEGAFERDSVVFDKLIYSETLLNAFNHIASENKNELSIVDFGGSLGSSYSQYKGLLQDKKINWSVIEQKHFVDFGKQNLENEQLKFYYTIEEAIKTNKPKVLLVACVIQYFEEPYELIQKLLQYDFEYLIIDRSAFIENDEDRITIQKVPSYIYEASYPAWFFNEQKFIGTFENKYDLLYSYLDDITNPVLLEGNKRAYWKGHIMKIK